MLLPRGSVTVTRSSSLIVAGIWIGATCPWLPTTVVSTAPLPESTTRIELADGNVAFGAEIDVIPFASGIEKTRPSGFIGGGVFDAVVNVTCGTTTTPPLASVRLAVCSEYAVDGRS